MDDDGVSGGVHYGTGYPDVYQHLPSSSHTDSLQTNFTFTKERIKMKMTLFISCLHYVNFKRELSALPSFTSYFSNHLTKDKSTNLLKK